VKTTLDNLEHDLDALLYFLTCLCASNVITVVFAAIVINNSLMRSYMNVRAIL
jgi:hypothetical protein